jgi:hypothetical protein
MQTAQEKIKTYLHDISHGVVNISNQHANALILFATGAEQVATAIMYKHNSFTGKSELMRTIETTDEQIELYANTSYMSTKGTAYEYKCLYGNGKEITLYSNQCALFD